MALLPYLQGLKNQHQVEVAVPVSAKLGKNTDRLLALITAQLPAGAHVFAGDCLTDLSDRFLAAEVIREKLMRLLHDELPYAVTVDVTQFEIKARHTHIAALIGVENAGQKGIVIGQKGNRLKQVGQQACYDIERLFDIRVYLALWVKVVKKST